MENKNTKTEIKTKKTVIIRLPQELYREIKQLADEHYQNLCGFITQLIYDRLCAEKARKYLEKRKDEETK